MNVGLYDADYKKIGNKFPNFALMKISTYHKVQGDEVGWANSNLEKFDRIYISRVFNFTADPLEDMFFSRYKGEIIKGGTGYNVKGKLSPEIDNMLPDYSIYPHVDYAIGFVTRGCPNHCYGCCVPEKEGDLSKYNTWQKIKRPDSNKIVFMDNNVLADPETVAEIETMKGHGIVFDFNQGLDAILFTKEHAKLFAGLKINTFAPRSNRWRKGIRFSCDKNGQLEHIRKCINYMAEVGYKARDIQVYCMLTDYESAVKRVNALRDMGVCINAQPYRDIHEVNVVPQWQKDMANWTFKKSEYWATSWEEYKK